MLPHPRPLKGHEQEIMARLASGEPAYKIAQQYGVTKSAITFMRRKYDLGMKYIFELAPYVKCQVRFSHTRPITRDHLKTLITHLQREMDLLGNAGWGEKEEEGEEEEEVEKQSGEP